MKSRFTADVLAIPITPLTLVGSTLLGFYLQHVCEIPNGSPASAEKFIMIFVVVLFLAACEFCAKLAKGGFHVSALAITMLAAFLAKVNYDVASKNLGDSDGWIVLTAQLLIGYSSIALILNDLAAVIFGLKRHSPEAE